MRDSGESAAVAPLPLGALRPRAASRLVKPQVQAQATSTASNQEPDCGRVPLSHSTQHQEQQVHRIGARVVAPVVTTTAAQPATPRTGRVVVLRKCEDLHIRTGGFQTIDEQAWRPRDLRRSQQRPATAPHSS